VKNKKIEFIAEVSSNHSKDLDRCLKFVDISADIGCSAVKFQLFRIDQLFAKDAIDRYEEIKLRKNWELPLSFIPNIANRCKEKNIQFGCTPFYLDAVDELYDYVDFFKIASYELLWDDLLIKCAKTKKPIMISTGMADMSEISHATKILRLNGCSNPRIFHCTSSYPTPPGEANLSAIETIRSKTMCDVGWSDHTVNNGVIHRAIHKWGSTFIEFHLDIEGKGEEFSSGHCWLPSQMKELIHNINDSMISDGNGVKEPVNSELPDLPWRTDPSDGLRPFKSIRDQLKKDIN